MAFAGWGRDNPANMRDILHPDCELIVPESLPYGGTFRGSDAAIAWFTHDLWEWFDEFTSTPEDLIDAGDRIIVPVHVQARRRTAAQWTSTTCGSTSSRRASSPAAASTRTPRRSATPSTQIRNEPRARRHGFEGKITAVESESVIDPHIGGKSQTRSPDATIAALAGRQHGVVSRRQLLELGVGRRAIERRIEGNRLHVVHVGVYAVGHRVLTPHGRWMAAVLGAGPDAVLSHRSAAALWGIRPTSAARVEVTTPRDLRRRTHLHPHRAVLPADEVTRKDGIPVTTPERTLLDLAAVTQRHELDRALDEAEILRLPGPQHLLDRHPHHRGTTNLRALLLHARRSTRSPLEAEFLEFVDDHGFERPETNTIIEGYEVDAVWREQRLIVELDGYATHGTRRAFERDRARDRKLSAKGWRPIRLTSLHPAEADELGMLGAPRISGA